MDAQTLMTALIKADDSRARSQQTEIGVSQLGGCRKQVWLQLQGTPKTNEPLRLPAIMGTAIHAAIEAAFADSDALIETRVEIDGLPPATIDYYDPATKTVTDWKTITLKNVNYFVGTQKVWQVMVYAHLLIRKGHQVDWVELVGIPRDGTERNIIVHRQPYDESIALQALAWLEDVKGYTVAPAPERDGVFCRDYCPFFNGACNGIPKKITGEAITDDNAARAAADYLAISEQIKALELAKDAARAALEGVHGVTFDGVKVAWSEVAGRSTPDMDAIKAVLGTVPMKQGAPSYRLSVK